MRLGKFAPLYCAPCCYNANNKRPDHPPHYKSHVYLCHPWLNRGHRLRTAGIFSFDLAGEFVFVVSKRSSPKKPHDDSVSTAAVNNTVK